jgi:hypothetical protein
VDTKRFLTGTIVGGIVLYIVGYLIFSMAFASFYAANTGSATGVDRESEVMWAVVLGAFAYAALICYTMGRRGVSGLGEGFMVGAIVGFLLWACADFTLYGVENVSNLTRTVVDPLLEIVHGGIGGATIALVASKAGSAT